MDGMREGRDCRDCRVSALCLPLGAEFFFDHRVRCCSVCRRWFYSEETWTAYIPALPCREWAALRHPSYCDPCHGKVQRGEA